MVCPSIALKWAIMCHKPMLIALSCTDHSSGSQDRTQGVRLGCYLHGVQTPGVPEYTANYLRATSNDDLLIGCFAARLCLLLACVRFITRRASGVCTGTRLNNVIIL